MSRGWHLASVDEAEERMAPLRAHGPTPYAFTFNQRFSAEEAAVALRPDSD